MRISFRVFLLILVSANNNFAQDTTFELNRTNATKIQLLTDIEQITGYKVSYVKIQLEASPRVTIHAKGTLHQLLTRIFKDDPVLTFAIHGTSIVIFAHPVIEVRGKVQNDKGQPEQGVSVLLKRNGKAVETGRDGGFKIICRQEGDTLIFSSVSLQTSHLPVQNIGTEGLLITLRARISEISTVTKLKYVLPDIINRQEIAALSKIDQAQLDNRYSANIHQQLEGLVAGFLYTSTGNSRQVRMRGANTLFAYSEPLLVLNKIPFDGTASSINTNDIESIKVLKDAAALTKYGVQAGNSVLEITTRKAEFNQPLRVELNASTSLQPRPDLYYNKNFLSSRDYIAVEKFLYYQGYYDAKLAATFSYPVVSPVVEILNDHRNGRITSQQADEAIAALSKLDVRNELKEYFYQAALGQQIAFNVSSGTSNRCHYFSFGFDNQPENLVRNGLTRLTGNSTSTIAFWKHRLQFRLSVLFANTQYTNNNTGGIGSNYPYLQLVDADKKALAIPFARRTGFMDTAGNGKLHNWLYKPYDELALANNSGSLTDVVVASEMKLAATKKISGVFMHQFHAGYERYTSLKSPLTWEVRDLINRFTEINGSTVIRHVPDGGIKDESRSVMTGQLFSAQIDYADSSDNKNSFWGVLAGVDMKTFLKLVSTARLYGYTDNTPGGTLVDYLTPFPQYRTGNTAYIPNYNFTRRQVHNFYSSYLNAHFTLNGKYMFYANARKDESNLFGVQANQKGTPLWSAGFGWVMTRERFFKKSQFDYIRLRVTVGEKGNVDKTASSSLVARLDATDGIDLLSGTIINPSNQELRWEKTRMVNVGLDVIAFNNALELSLDCYRKTDEDLIGDIPLTGTMGSSSVRGNSAAIKGQGLEFTFRAKIFDRQFRWYATLIGSASRERISKYELSRNTVAQYLNKGMISPMQGKSPDVILALPWAGLDSAGMPVGYLDGQKSQDYPSIINSPDLSNLVAIGQSTPPFFGSLINTFAWKQFSLSASIMYKTGHYFRKSAINYTELFEGISPGHAEYAQAGNENSQVPALAYPADRFRDFFYNHATVNVLRADHIRILYIRLQYDLNKNIMRWAPFQTFRLYAHIDNPGILWRANKAGEDPEVFAGPPRPVCYTIGIKLIY